MTAALVLKNLTKTYDTGLQALKGINLTVEQGAFYALLGPNGAGKSTTIGIVSSLVRKTSGSVEIFGIDLEKSPSAAKQMIGLVPQEFNFGMFEKVFDILVTQAGYYGLPRKVGEQRAEKYLKLLGLWDKRNTVSRMLSGGMKRRLMIARAMVHEPQLLILDEPTAGVDIELRRSMWSFLTDLNTQGVTIILTTHYLEEAESLCKRIAIIDQGVIKEDTDMKTLLAKLSVETFVCDLSMPIDNLPNLELKGVSLSQEDPTTIELVIPKSTPLNDVFAALTAKGLNISSMRNKTNRLEELFVHMVEKNLPPQKTTPTKSNSHVEVKV